MFLDWKGKVCSITRNRNTEQTDRSDGTIYTHPAGDRFGPQSGYQISSTVAGIFCGAPQCVYTNARTMSE